MPQYMLLIYQPEQNPLSPQEMQEMSVRFDEYTDSLKRAGAWVGGDALQAPTAATTVRERGGETQFTDGPFAETKEYLAGYYLIDAPDLDAALDHASRMPNISWGSVEVRPLWDRTDPRTRAEQAQASA